MSATTAVATLAWPGRVQGLTKEFGEVQVLRGDDAMYAKGAMDREGRPSGSSR